MRRRASILAIVVGLAVVTLIAGPLQGVAWQDQATPDASPEASPAASPEASPIALVRDVEAGKALASQCISCHSVDGSQMVGPTWLGLYGEEVELEDGSIVVANEVYLTESIKDPNAKIVAGFPAGAMPPYGAILTDQQIADLVAYIKSLGEEDDDDDDGDNGVEEERQEDDD
jgi:mono/diheme cytochrome c family protein